MKLTRAIFASIFLIPFAYGQIKKEGNQLTIKPQFEVDKTYHYELTITETDLATESILQQQIIPVEVKLATIGEGYNLFEWKSKPMLFIPHQDDYSGIQFPSDEVVVNYRTDENFIMGEISNYEELMQVYSSAYENAVPNYAITDEIVSKAPVYFVQMFNMFFGQAFEPKKKELMMNLFFHPMKGTFAPSEDEIVCDQEGKFTMIQKYNMDMEDSSVKMINSKTVGDYRSQQTGATYKLKANGNQTYTPDGLIQSILRTVEVEQNGQKIVFQYALTKK